MAPTNEHNGSSKRRANSLIALSSAAVLTVYGAGYMRTRAAAERFAEEPVRRRPAPVAIEVSGPMSPTTSLPASGTDVAKPTAVATGAVVNAAAEAVSAPSTNAPALRENRPESAVKPPVSLTPAASTGTAAAAPVPAAPPELLPTLTSVAAAMSATSLPSVGQTGQLAPPPPKSLYKDGTFSGWGTCRHGDIEATVTIAAGRILSARISGCYTRYSCSVIDPLPPQVAIRQSPEVDYVSGATQSANAFYYAVLEALTKAK